MEIGAGNANKDWNMSFRHRISYSHKNRFSYWRMRFILNPLSHVLMENWLDFTRVEELTIKKHIKIRNYE